MPHAQERLPKMKSALIQRLGRPVGAVALLGASSAVLAQSITYQPLATAIPSLSGVGLVLLATLMAGAAWRFNRKGQGMPGGRFMGLALVVGAVASGASGVKLIEEAWALDPNVSLDSPTGGTKPLHAGLNCVVNTTNVTQQIVDIDTTIPANNGGTTGVGSVGAVGVANAGACPTPFNATNAGAAPECVDSPTGTILRQNDVCSVLVPPL